MPIIPALEGWEFDASLDYESSLKNTQKGRVIKNPLSTGKDVHANQNHNVIPLYTHYNGYYKGKGSPH